MSTGKIDIGTWLALASSTAPSAVRRLGGARPWGATGAQELHDESSDRDGYAVTIHDQAQETRHTAPRRVPNARRGNGWITK